MLMVCTCFLVPQRGVRRYASLVVSRLQNAATLRNGPALTAALLQIVSAAAAGEATPIVFENQRHDNLRCSKAACFQKSLLTKS
jgi:hypothetical protein